MTIRTSAKILYAIVGVSLLLIGVIVSLLRTGLLPEAVQNFSIRFTDGNPNALHITQEFGALMIFAGLISLWFIRHYEQSKAFHWAMTTFWAFVAFAHFGAAHKSPGPIINSVPFLLFAVVGLIRWRSERKTDR
jgi:hypothetical protein